MNRYSKLHNIFWCVTMLCAAIYLLPPSAENLCFFWFYQTIKIEFSFYALWNHCTEPFDPRYIWSCRQDFSSFETFPGWVFCCGFCWWWWGFRKLRSHILFIFGQLRVGTTTTTNVDRSNKPGIYVICFATIKPRQYESYLGDTNHIWYIINGSFTWMARKIFWLRYC